jgi:hypothetical protein
MARTQIPLAPEQHEEPAEIARGEGTSLSQIVRAAVKNWLSQHGDDELLRQRLNALDRGTEHRRAVLARRGGRPLEAGVSAIIDEEREERDDGLRAGIGGHRG